MLLQPELELHLLAITLLTELQQRVARHMQIIVSTQSVSLVDELEPAELVVDREPSSSP